MWPVGGFAQVRRSETDIRFQMSGRLRGSHYATTRDIHKSVCSSLQNGEAKEPHC
jgi:hypothetical protein